MPLLEKPQLTIQQLVDAKKSSCTSFGPYCQDSIQLTAEDHLYEESQPGMLPTRGVAEIKLSLRYGTCLYLTTG